MLIANEQNRLGIRNAQLALIIDALKAAQQALSDANPMSAV